jgi:hypothetical protein
MQTIKLGSTFQFLDWPALCPYNCWSTANHAGLPSDAIWAFRITTVAAKADHIFHIIVKLRGGLDKHRK